MNGPQIHRYYADRFRRLQDEVRSIPVTQIDDFLQLLQAEETEALRQEATAMLAEEEADDALEA